MPLDIPFERFRPDPFLFDAGGSRWAVPPAVWTPASLSAVKAWWSADDHGTANMTDDGGGLISSWKDRIGGLALTAATTARPTWGATAFNGAKAGLTFDGSANNLTGTTLTGLPVAAVAGAVWSVGEVTTAVTATVQSIAAYGSGAALRRLGVHTSGVLKATGDTAECLQTTPLANGAAFFFEGIFDANVTSYWNGVGATPVANSLNTATTRIRIGATTGTSATQFFGGAVRHYLITTALSTLQRQQLEGWLAWDSGLQSLLPAGHPYLSGPP